MANGRYEDSDGYANKDRVSLARILSGGPTHLREDDLQLLVEIALLGLRLKETSLAVRIGQTGDTNEDIMRQHGEWRRSRDRLFEVLDNVERGTE